MTAFSSDTNNTLITAVGALLIALIAGAFSLVGLVISKEQKVSEFRQSWIDALRQDVADLIAYANIVHAELLKFAKEATPDPIAFLSRNRDNYVATNRASTRIKLRLNGKEDESKSLLLHIKTLEGLLGKDAKALSDSQTEIGPINEEIQTSAGTILKTEWKRVKKGERQYRFAKYAALAFLSLALILGCIAVYAAWGLGLFTKLLSGR